MSHMEYVFECECANHVVKFKEEPVGYNLWTIPHCAICGRPLKQMLVNETAVCKVHCFHKRHTSYGTDGGCYEETICCYCGKIETNHYPPPSPESTIYKEYQHGPYDPCKNVVTIL